jgi:hypothetical protein
MQAAMQSPVNDITGDVEAMAHYAGQGVGAVRQVLPARRIIEELARGFRPSYSQ